MKVGSKIALATSVAALSALPAAALANPGHGHGTSKLTAEKQCRTQLAAMGRSTFDMTFVGSGTNKNKRNAFGKCVSAIAKAQQDQQPTQPTT
jgi:hypothetical protein